MKIMQINNIIIQIGFICPNQGKDMELQQNTYLYNNRYCIQSCLGNGGFGITYVAWDFMLKREVVLKEYFPQFMVRRDTAVANDVITISRSYDNDFHTGIEKFLREAQMLATLKGIPEIAEVYDYFRDNNTAYIVMEYIKGRNLKEYIRERTAPFSYHEALNIIIPCLNALGKVHAAGIIHRDFTPDNIIIENSGRIRIIDFGSSRDYVNNQATMTVMVKHGYAPVEQYSNTVKQAAYTDVYSVCAILYEMVTLNKPVSALDRVASDILPGPNTINSSITPYQNAAIMKGLAIHCQHRYQSTAEALNALCENGAANTVIIQNTPDAEYDYDYDLSKPSRERKASRLFMIACSVFGVLIAVLIALIVVKLNSGKGKSETDGEVEEIRKVADKNDSDYEMEAAEATYDEETSAAASPEEPEDSEEVSRNINVDNDNFTLLCNKITIATDMDDNPVAIVYFRFTNKTGNPLCMTDVFVPGFRQNGQTLSIGANLYTYPEEVLNTTEPVSDGKTIDCAFVVQLNDEKSELTITMHDNYETFSEIGTVSIPIS